jgi:hypothetical protein
VVRGSCGQEVGAVALESGAGQSLSGTATKSAGSTPTPATASPKAGQHPTGRHRLSHGGRRRRHTGTYLDPGRAEINLADHAENWITAHPDKRRTAPATPRICAPTSLVASPSPPTRPARPNPQPRRSPSGRFSPLNGAAVAPRSAARITPVDTPLAPARRTLHACLQAAVDEGAHP